MHILVNEADVCVATNEGHGGCGLELGPALLLKVVIVIHLECLNPVRPRPQHHR